MFLMWQTESVPCEAPRKSLVNMLLSAVSRNRKRGKLTSAKSVQFAIFQEFR
jgi:hypothetical protein